MRSDSSEIQAGGTFVGRKSPKCPSTHGIATFSFCVEFFQCQHLLSRQNTHLLESGGKKEQIQQGNVFTCVRHNLIKPQATFPDTSYIYEKDKRLSEGKTY